MFHRWEALSAVAASEGASNRVKGAKFPRVGDFLAWASCSLPHRLCESPAIARDLLAKLCLPTEMGSWNGGGGGGNQEICKWHHRHTWISKNTMVLPTVFENAEVSRALWTVARQSYCYTWKVSRGKEGGSSALCQCTSSFPVQERKRCHCIMPVIWDSAEALYNVMTALPVLCQK